MRKLLFLLLALLSNIGFCNDGPPINIDTDSYNTDEDHRNESSRTNFTAELLTNGFIKVLSSDVTTFTVKICNASTGAVLYQGSTVNGILHITAHSLLAGRYELKIETADAQYLGVFNI